MKIIGITGGVGSGKSEILNILKNDYQAKVIQSDHVAHELMVPGAKSYDAIVQAFGNEILNEDQTINRPILGEIVFHDETKLSLLNSITHKNVDEEILSRIDQFEKEEPEGLLVIESALLVGAGYEKRFDQLWYIYTREEVRYERLKASRGYSDEKIKQMIEKQQKEEEFKSMASNIIDNSGDLEDTKDTDHKDSWLIFCTFKNTVQFLNLK